MPESLTGVSHWPQRPSWLCCVDGEPWPCAPGRVELAEAYGEDRVGMAVYMGVLMGWAIGEAGPIVASELHERFIVWTR